MRIIKGHVVFPADAPRQKAALVCVELHDVSLQDVASKRLTQTKLKDVPIKPGARVAFRIKAPETASSCAFRVHVDWDGDGKVAAGDLLTTQTIYAPEDGEAEVPVTLI